MTIKTSQNIYCWAFDVLLLTNKMEIDKKSEFQNFKLPAVKSTSSKVTKSQKNNV